MLFTTLLLLPDEPHDGRQDGFLLRSHDPQPPIDPAGNPGRKAPGELRQRKDHDDDARVRQGDANIPHNTVVQIIA
jgi:hypothetical protein